MRAKDMTNDKVKTMAALLLPQLDLEGWTVRKTVSVENKDEVSFHLEKVKDDQRDVLISFIFTGEQARATYRPNDSHVQARSGLIDAFVLGHVVPFRIPYLAKEIAPKSVVDASYYQLISGGGYTDDIGALAAVGDDSLTPTGATGVIRSVEVLDEKTPPTQAEIDLATSDTRVYSAEELENAARKIVQNLPTQEITPKALPFADDGRVFQPYGLPLKSILSEMEHFPEDAFDDALKAMGLTRTPASETLPPNVAVGQDKLHLNGHHGKAAKNKFVNIFNKADMAQGQTQDQILRDNVMRKISHLQDSAEVKIEHIEALARLLLPDLHPGKEARVACTNPELGHVFAAFCLEDLCKHDGMQGVLFFRFEGLQVTAIYRLNEVEVERLEGTLQDLVNGKFATFPLAAEHAANIVSTPNHSRELREEDLKKMARQLLPFMSEELVSLWVSETGCDKHWLRGNNFTYSLSCPVPHANLLYRLSLHIKGGVIDVTLSESGPLKVAQYRSGKVKDFWLGQIAPFEAQHPIDAPTDAMKVGMLHNAPFKSTRLATELVLSAKHNQPQNASDAVKVAFLWVILERTLKQLKMARSAIETPGDLTSDCKKNLLEDINLACSSAEDALHKLNQTPREKKRGK